MASEKTVLITGTSSGIGLATAVAAAQAGWTTIATMRDTGKAEALLKAAAEHAVADRVQVKRLDVADADSITACLDEVIAEHGRLDALVNNAGAARVGTIEQMSLDDVRATMEVNFFGVVSATRAALPHLRASRGRVITVTSVGGAVGQPFNEAYCAAKFAVEGFYEALAPVAKRFGIHVSIVEPGAVNTEFVARVARDVAARPEPVSPPYQRMMAAYREATTAAFARGQTPDDVARVIVEAAQAEAPHFRYVTSEFVRGVAALKYVDPTGDSVVALAGSRLPPAAK
jgi:NAD(P)-dependent dehydrogenase (short-subunit alcohol dehydrogenase family)